MKNMRRKRQSIRCPELKCIRFTTSSSSQSEQTSKYSLPAERYAKEGMNLDFLSMLESVSIQEMHIHLLAASSNINFSQSHVAPPFLENTTTQGTDTPFEDHHRQQPLQ